MNINKQKADLNKDGNLSGYEKKRGMAIQTAMKKEGSKPKPQRPDSLRKPTDKKFMGMTSYKENM